MADDAVKKRPALLRAADQRMVLKDLSDAVQKGIKWALVVYEDSAGDYQICCTDAPDRYHMIGALEDLKHDLLKTMDV